MHGLFREDLVSFDRVSLRLVMRSHEVMEADKTLHVNIDLTRARVFPRP